MNKQFIVRGDIPKEPALTIKNQLLLSPGEWKGQKITREAILEGIRNTNWDSQEARSLIYGHRTNDESTYYGDPSPDEWVGYHSEPRYLTSSDGVDYEGMYADLYIYDNELASKLAYGNAKAGISEGMEYDYYSGKINKFINSSVVNNPACKLAYLNLSEDSKVAQVGLMEPRFLNLAEVTNMEEKREELGMSVEEFYAVPKDPPSSSKLPIFDESHIKNAMARFNQTEFSSKEEEREAYNKILRKAKDKGINVDEFNELKDKLNLAKESYSDKGERRSNKMEDKIAEMEKRLNALEATKLNLSEESDDKTEDSNESPSEDKSDSKSEESNSGEGENQSGKAQDSAANNSSKEPEGDKEQKEDKSSNEDNSSKEDKSSEDSSKKSEDSDKSKPVVMEKKGEDKSNSNSSDDKVVEAINRVGEKMAEEFKKAAKPQSSAPTNPDASMSNTDEQVTKRLIERYNKLHQ